MDKNPVILLVEDEPAMREGLAHNLEFEGSDVRGAADRRAGLEASRGVIVALYGDRLVDVVDGAFMSDHKSRLQELSAQRFGELPRYKPGVTTIDRIMLAAIRMPMTISKTRVQLMPLPSPDFIV